MVIKYCTYLFSKVFHEKSDQTDFPLDMLVPISKGLKLLNTVVWGIFTGPIQSLSCNVRESSVCLSVCLCHCRKKPHPGGLDTSGQRRYRYNWQTSGHFGIFLMIFSILIWVLGSLRTSLLCIMGELAGGEFVALAVGISDR